MTSITYNAAQQDLAGTIDCAYLDHNPLIITRDDGQPAVILSLEDYQSLEETAYLSRSPANVQRLLESILELNLMSIA